MIGVVTVIVMIIVGVATSTAPDAATRWRRTIWSAAGAVGWLLLASMFAWGQRGGRPGATLTAVAFVVAWAWFRLVVDGNLRTLLAPDDGTLVAMPVLRGPSAPRTAIVGLLGLAAVVWSLVPLRFVGALVDEPKASVVARTLSMGNFGPLEQLLEIEVGQCLANRLPREVNRVVPCDHPHRAEVIAEVGPGAACPEIDASGYDVGPMRVVRTDPIAEVVFCVAQALDPKRRWRIRPGAGAPHLPNTR